MKELIDGLRNLARQDSWASEPMRNAADALESQAREIEALSGAHNDAVYYASRNAELRAELSDLKSQPSGVVGAQRLLDWNRAQPEPRPIVIGREYQVAEACARLNQPASAGDIFVVGYHCRDSKGIATINWLPHENAVPLMTVAQHQRILASATKQAGEVAYDVFVSRELLDLLADAEKNERHRNLKETRYWCDQYRQIARAALSANHSEQVRVVLPKPLKRGDTEAERGEYGGAMARGYSAYERQLIRLNPGLAFAAAPSAPSRSERVLDRYTCIGKGGDYQLLGIAQGAGTLKGFNHMVYRNVDGVMFVREPEDFLARMEKIAVAPSAGSQGGDV